MQPVAICAMLHQCFTSPRTSCRTKITTQRCLRGALSAGWGNWVNTLVLVILLALFGQFGPVYDADQLEIVWRLSFILGLAPIVVRLSTGAQRAVARP